MAKVQLPKVEEETRTELSIIKYRRNDTTISKTLDYLVSVEKENEELKKKIKELEDKNKTLKQIMKMKDDLEGFESQYKMTGKE